MYKSDFQSEDGLLRVIETILIPTNTMYSAKAWSVKVSH